MDPNNIPNDPNGAFVHVLQHVIGLDTPQKRNAVLVNAGVTTIDDILYVDMDSLLSCLTANTTVMAKTRLKTLKKWAEEEYDLHGEVDITKFTEELCREKQRLIAKTTKVTTSTLEKGTATKEKLTTFNGKRENWLKAKRELTAYLNQIKNEQGVPIYYVIRDPDEEEKYRADNGELGRMIYEAPFVGRVYESDAFQVLQILRQWTSGGTAETFVDNNNNVQDAWAQLISNYEGHDARSANIAKNRNIVNTSTWVRNTHNYTFDDYCNKHIKANNELDRYNANVDGVSQVDYFMKGIRADARVNPHLLAVKAIIWNGADTKGNLRNAITAFKDTTRSLGISVGDYKEQRYVGSINRGRGHGGGRGGGRNGGRGGRFGGRGGQGGRGGHGGRGYNQQQSYFIPQDVLDAVGPKYRAMLYKGRDVMEKEDKKSMNSGGDSEKRNNGEKRNASSTSTTNESPDPPKIEELDDDGGASSNFGTTGRKKQRSLGAIISSSRRIGRAIQVKVPNDYDKRARAEIDTRADTLCAGSTFILHEATGKVVDVSGFHDSLEAIKNIQVGTCITAIDLENETIIASFPQSLYFGDTMENSLVPPAQLWDYGITVDVVPKQYSDGKSLHGIHHPDEQVFIPFHLHGCISYFTTRLPRPEEIANCRWVTFTSDAEWNPYSDHFHDSEMAMVNKYRYPDPTHVHFDHKGNELDGRTIHKVDTSVGIVDLTLQTFDVVYNRFIGATSSTEHRSSVPMDVLARRWGTSLLKATETVKQTTQRGVRYLLGPLSRRFRTRQKQLEHRYLNTRMYTDTFFKETTSARGNTCAQLFVTAEGFVAGEPMKSKADAYEALDHVCRDYGIPKLLVSDNAKEETFGNWGKIIKHYLIKQRVTEPYSGWQNRCEDEIREVRKHFARIMALHRCPDAFWDFALEYVIKLRQFIVRAAAGDRSPLETVTGDTPDTSEYMVFDFYQWVKYRDQVDKDDPVKLGRWLGVAHDVGCALTYWVLKGNGQVITRSTVRPLLPEEEKDETEIKERASFDAFLKEKFGEFDPTEINVYDNDDMEDPHAMDDDVNGEGVGDAHTNEKDNDVKNGTELMAKRKDDEMDDKVRGPDLFQNAEIYLPHGDRNEIAKVIGRKRDQDGNFIGRAHKNPMLDSRIFTVRFADGEEKDITFNLLAEHLFSQVDAEGNQYRIFREIINHRRNKNALDKADQYRIMDNGKRVMKRSTAGWDFEVEWKDGSTSWLPLKELKETNAVEIAQYARDNRIIEEPAFSWWAPQVLKKMQRLIKMSKSRHTRRGYKFGIRIPNSVKEALEIDAENGNTLWYDAIMKEMGNVRVAFEMLEEKAKPPPGYKYVELMMIFDVKMDFTRKARLVARGDMTETPSTLTYSSVVSRESVRIAFLIAALNDLDLVMFDVGNAYLNAPTTEKLYCYAGKEFGADEEGRLMIIRRALYGLKSSGAAYRAHFATTLMELGFKSCRADPDVWMRTAMKENGFEYYEYILTYVDDCLVVSHKPDLIVSTLSNEYKYRLKDIGEPKRYLGAAVGKYMFNDGTYAWYMSAQLYLERAITEIERKWGNLSKLFPRQTLDVPMQAGSHPELDTSKFLDDETAQLYQSYIGILRWAVELGRVDLAYSAGVMARFSAAPREGHMVEVLRILAYCKKHLESKIVFDTVAKDFENIEWIRHDWKQFYPDLLGEVLPPSQPPARGNPVQINIFCDAAHATCHLTRRSTTGIIFFLNGAPISWYSKRQNTIESSTFGSEFVALRIATEMNEALRYKLRMMGIPINGESNCFCDNKSVVTNAVIPQSTLSKKHNMVAYHKVRESVAVGAIRIAHEKGKFNLSDCLTKFLPAPSFKRCVQCILMR